jgi:hypothetical protein
MNDGGVICFANMPRDVCAPFSILVFFFEFFRARSQSDVVFWFVVLWASCVSIHVMCAQR